MMIVTILAWLAAAPVAFLFAAFLAESILGQFGRTRSVRQVGQARRIAILMPAHDEEAGLARIIADIRPVLPDGARLLVVADNCTDRTAVIAHDAGAEVIERNNVAERGKGYALAFGQDHLRRDPPDCVIVVDADCFPEPGTLAHLAEEACLTGCPVQACYLMTPDRAAGPMVEISNFAFLVKNLVRQRGAARLGGPALLTGTGMAFPWTIFADAPLASGNIVEDLALGIHFTRTGHAPRFLESARVWSAAASAPDTLTQRTRWEHGFVATARSHGLPLMAEGMARAHWSIFWLGLHLLVPPLALLFVIGGALLAVLLVMALAGAGPWPAIVLATLMALSVVAVISAWARFGRETLAARTLLRLPFYILWKIPVYLKLARGAETRWVRTKRSDE